MCYVPMEDVLMAQLPVPGVQSSHEWGLWSDGGWAGDLKSLSKLGWLVDRFIQKDCHWGSSPGVGRTGLMERRPIARCLPRDGTGNSSEVRWCLGS